ncbi:MAG: glycoside hydrolase family 5 protein [Cytophagaceae bacterium]
MNKTILILLALFFSYQSIYAQEFVKREGVRLMHHGEEIKLRGFAFGNLVWADVPVPSVHHTEEDFLILKNMGMNAVRFYLNYITFEEDDDPYSYKDAGWEWLDENIKWAKKHGIYLILNIHVPQGGFQSMCEGDALWNEYENQDRLVGLWKAIAERYKDEPQIAGYDILNEPIPTTSVTQWSQLAQRIIDSIRTVDVNHLIITERAIAVGCDYGFNDGKKNYPDVKEENLMYTVHLYDPFEFTHQNLSWAKTGDGGKYPDESQVTPPADLAYATGNYNNPRLESGSSGWKFYEGKPFQVKADSLIVGRIVFTASLLGNGKAFFDDLILEEVDQYGTRLRIIQKYDLTGATYWYWSEKNDGNYTPQSSGHGDASSVMATGASGNATVTLATSAFPVNKGSYYKVSGWMKGENIPSGAGASITTEFYYSPSSSPVFTRNRDYLKSTILNYSKYVRDLNYPVYFGEFGVARNAFENGKGGELWVKDAIEIFDSLGFHWTYHSYKESSFGYYDGWLEPTDRSTVNKKLDGVFRKHLQKDVALPKSKKKK